MQHWQGNTFITRAEFKENINIWPECASLEGVNHLIYSKLFKPIISALCVINVKIVK